MRPLSKPFFKEKHFIAHRKNSHRKNAQKNAHTFLPAPPTTQYLVKSPIRKRSGRGAAGAAVCCVVGRRRGRWWLQRRGWFHLR